eukprot:CAMPEP_0173323630 /NCGR_PEP_ID=MMETSP1143-20121109/30624_1 /TAXON_ID=483371 /ORGANISM="non described non described, Strain CCMP2298" /LENGTH=203 /DNA_ID=CAMNT_0014267617 /DNA_START=86 /DNA_END=698 /DNA_ORIENTATION=+
MSEVPTTRIKPCDDYRLIYPYKHIDSEVQKEFVGRQSKVYQIKELIEKRSDVDVFDAIMFSLNYIEKTFQKDFSKCRFMDCMSFSGAASFFAVPFGFSDVVGIEYAHEGFDRAELIKKHRWHSLQSTTASSSTTASKLLSGTYLICVTMGTSLSTPDLIALGFPGFTCMFNKPMLPLGRNRATDRTHYDKQVWILRSSRSAAV